MKHERKCLGNVTVFSQSYLDLCNSMFASNLFAEISNTLMIILIRSDEKLKIHRHLVFIEMIDEPDIIIV